MQSMIAFKNSGVRRTMLKELNKKIIERYEDIKTFFEWYNEYYEDEPYTAREVDKMMFAYTGISSNRYKTWKRENR